MSYWTYVNGIIKVDTFALSDAEAMYKAQTVINHLPQITGSEGPAHVYCIRPFGSNWSSTTDEFGKETNLYTDHQFKTFEYQSDIIIALNGDLRDRRFDQTLRETTEWIARLSSRLGVYNCLISVESSHEHKKFIFHNPDWVINRDIGEWVDKAFPHRSITMEEVNQDESE